MGLWEGTNNYYDDPKAKYIMLEANLIELQNIPERFGNAQALARMFMTYLMVLALGTGRIPILPQVRSHFGFKRHGAQLLALESLEELIGDNSAFPQWRESTFLHNPRTRIGPPSRLHSDKPAVARVIMRDRSVGVQADAWDLGDKVKWYADDIGKEAAGDPYQKSQGKPFGSEMAHDMLFSAVRHKSVQRAGILSVDLKIIDQWFDVPHLNNYNGGGDKPWRCMACLYKQLRFCEVPDDTASNNREWTYVLMNTGTVCTAKKNKDQLNSTNSCSAQCAPL